MKRPAVTFRVSDGKGHSMTITTTGGEQKARRLFVALIPWCNPERLNVSRQCSHDNCRNFTAHANGVCSRHQSKEK